MRQDSQLDAEAIKKIVLASDKIACLGSFSRDMLRVQVDDDEERLLRRVVDDIIVKITTRVLSQSLDKRQIQVWNDRPATWWQQLKAERFPKWWLRRWPVKMKRELVRTVAYEVKAMYPEANVTPKILGKPVIHVFDLGDYCAENH